MDVCDPPRVPSRAEALLDVPAPVGSPQHSRLATGIVLGLVMGLVAMLLLGFIGTTVGAAGLLVGLLLAFVPVLPVLATFLWIDRYEPEPRRNIVVSVVWGASLAAFFALLVNSASVRLITAVGGSGHETAAVWVAPWIEEAAKGAVVVLVLLLRREEFDGVVDGIVIAGLSGLGFAFMENILVWGRIFESAQSDHGPVSGVFVVGVVFAVRAVFAPFAHPMFTAAFGIGLGLAAQHARSWRKAAAPALGFLVAVALHTVWNLSAVHGPSRFVAAYVLVMVPVFAGFVGIVVWARRREQAIILRHLPAYAEAGWLNADEVPALASLPARRWARMAVRRQSGRRAAIAERHFQHTATELAFLQHRASRGTAGADFARHQRELLLALARYQAARGHRQGADG
jgi:RsiW-degrading membrane proteinase PrsW (M82 family)